MHVGLDRIRELCGSDVVDLKLSLRQLVTQALFKQSTFENARYLGFEERHDRQLSAIPPEEHGACKRAFLAVVLAQNCFHEVTRTERTDYFRFFDLVKGDLGGPLPARDYGGFPSYDTDLIQGPVLRKVGLRHSGAFEVGPMPKALVLDYGPGSVRFYRTLRSGLNIGLFFSKLRLGNLGLDCRIEGKIGWHYLELPSIFNLRERWDFLGSGLIASR